MLTPIQFPKECVVSANEPISQHTTLRVGGPAEHFVTPKNVELLCECYRLCTTHGVPIRFLGRGSNLFCNDKGVAGVVLRTTQCQKIELFGNTVIAEAGVPLQTLIVSLRRASLGGIEYLASVPGNVGGAVWANAGRGVRIGKSIADFVEEVTCWNGVREIRLAKDQCGFGYRKSTFMDHPNLLITRVRFEFIDREPTQGQRLVVDRLAYVRKFHDIAKPNAGTVFKSNFVIPMRNAQRGKARFSNKTDNWILNCGQATANDVSLLLCDAEVAHISLGLPKPELEWSVW